MTPETKAPGKSLWGNLVSLVAEEDTPVQRPTLKETPTAANTAAVAAAVTSGYDQEMLATLQKVITNRKTSYTALIEASDKLKAVIPDDITRLKAAFAMISGEGQRTLDTITQALDVHSQDLSGELIRFKQASEGAVKAKVGSLRSTVQNLTASNETRTQQIANLQAQMATLQQGIAADTVKITELSGQANNAEAEIAATTEKFAAAVEYLRQDLNNKKSQLASALS